MNIPAGLTGILKQLAPILKVLGIDPDKIINKFGRAQIEPLFTAVIPVVTARLEKDGLTPAAKGDGPDAERLVIRAAMYLLAKSVFATKLPKGANVAADFLRDQHDDQVVALVSPQVNAQTTTAELVRIVSHEFKERIL